MKVNDDIKFFSLETFIKIKSFELRISIFKLHIDYKFLDIILDIRPFYTKSTLFATVDVLQGYINNINMQKYL